MDAERTDHDCLNDIFNHVFDILRFCVSCSDLKETSDLVMERPYTLTLSLLGIKIGNVRPLTELVCNRSDFCPKPYTGHRGRELSKMTFFGPYLNLGVCNYESDSYFFAGADSYFSGSHIPMDETRLKLYDNYQFRMNNYKVKHL